MNWTLKNTKRILENMNWILKNTEQILENMSWILKNMEQILKNPLCSGSKMGKKYKKQRVRYLTNRLFNRV
jgi:hypothetical protein